MSGGLWMGFVWVEIAHIKTIFGLYTVELKERTFRHPNRQKTETVIDFVAECGQRCSS